VINILNFNDKSYNFFLGNIISEGDIVLDVEKRKGVRDDGDLWPNGIIPYMFHDCKKIYQLFEYDLINEIF